MICGICKKTIPVEKYVSRRSTCSSCGGDLHVCLNCKFFSDTSHNRCLEPKAEFQRTRDKANFCDFFAVRPDSSSISGEKEKEEARKKLDELFGK